LGIYFNLSIWFKITDQTNYSFWITLAGAMASIVIIWSLLPIWGYFGAALSTLGCYLIMCVLCFFYGQKYYPIPYQTGKDILYLMVGFAISYGGFYLEIEHSTINFILKNSLILIFGASIFLLEKKQIMPYLKRGTK